ncbi:hypothetical protein FQN51_001022 [Onygenales sp. PD_10]|nr:hypothetical protein FQN51_001022 [Onygenales sp. PD_10]
MPLPYGIRITPYNGNPFLPTSPNPSVRLEPGPDGVPQCCLCGELSTQYRTRSSNRNGNAGRYYYKCTPCGKFLGFNDRRGNLPENPECECGVPSKQQRAGADSKVPGGLHYVCRKARCDFYLPAVNGRGEQVVIEEVFCALFAKMGVV